MTSQTENSNLEMKLLDLQKKFGEEKKAHGETILQLLSAQEQAQTAEAEAAKAQELLTETTLKLDQARGEIKSLRCQAEQSQYKINHLEAQMAQTAIEAQKEMQNHWDQAQELREAQAKIKDLEAQVTQLKLSEKSQARAANDAEKEIRSLRAQTQESHEAQAKNQESLAQELQEAQAKIASLEAQMVQACLVIEPKTQETQESLSQLLLASQAQVNDLKSEMSQTAIETQEEIWFLRALIQNQKKQAQELQKKNAKAQESRAEELASAQAQVKDLESKVAQAQEEVGKLRAQTEAFGAQAQKFQKAQDKIKDLEAQMAQAVIETKSQAQELQKAQAKIKDLEAQVPKPPAPAPAIMCEKYTFSQHSHNQYFCIVQNDLRLYLVHMNGCHVFTKFVPKRNATLELAPGFIFSHSHRVTVSDGQDWKVIGYIGPENKTILLGSLVWSWVTKRTPARINADGNEEYQLAICVDI